MTPRKPIRLRCTGRSLDRPLPLYTHGRKASGLLRASRSAIDPRPHRSSRVIARQRRQRSSVTRIPAPADEIIMCHMIEQRFERPPAILFGIFQLAAQRSGRAPHKNHLVFRRRQTPLRIPRGQVRSGQVAILMTSIATHRRNAVPIHPAPHVLQMDMTVITLQRRIPRRMAILASRRRQHFVYLQESNL